MEHSIAVVSVRAEAAKKRPADAKDACLVVIKVADMVTRDILANVIGHVAATFWNILSADDRVLTHNINLQFRHFYRKHPVYQKNVSGTIVY